MILTCDFVITLHDIYSSRTLHVNYIHVTECMHGLIVPDLLLCLFMLMLSFSSRYCRIYCSFILMPYLYWYYTSIFLFLLFFPFLCALAGPVLPDPNFSALELEIVEPLYEGTETIRREYRGPCPLLYFGSLFCYDNSAS